MVSRVHFGWGRENSNSTVALQHEIHTSLLLPKCDLFKYDVISWVGLLHVQSHVMVSESSQTQLNILQKFFISVQAG